MTASWLLAAVILLLILILWARRRSRDAGPPAHQLIGVRSDVDGRHYRVQEGQPDPRRAADLLARIHERVVALCRALRRQWLWPGLSTPEPLQRTYARNLLARYNPDTILENSPNDPSGDTSYTIDKGRVVALCLRERDPTASGDPEVQDLHDLETLTFVAFHEMAHVATDAVDHPPEFWACFRFLLETAERENIYTSPRYQERPVEYCGTVIDYNPRYGGASAPVPPSGGPAAPHLG